MRNTTLILVILLLAGATVMERRTRAVSGHLQMRNAAFARETTACETAIADTAETRQIKDAIDDVDGRIRATESALRSLEKNEHAIEGLVRSAERDAKSAMREISDSTLRSIYEKNLRDLRHQLVEIRTARARLVAQRDSLKAEKIGLTSRLELTRITSRYTKAERIAEELEKPSPIDSLDGRGSVAVPLNAIDLRSQDSTEVRSTEGHHHSRTRTNRCGESGISRVIRTFISR